MLVITAKTKWNEEVRAGQLLAWNKDGTVSEIPPRKLPAWYSIKAHIAKLLSIVFLTALFSCSNNGDGTLPILRVDASMPEDAYAPHDGGPRKMKIDNTCKKDDDCELRFVCLESMCVTMCNSQADCDNGPKSTNKFIAPYNRTCFKGGCFMPCVTAEDCPQGLGFKCGRICEWRYPEYNVD